MSAEHTPGPWLRNKTTVYALDETGKCNRFFALFQGGFVRHPDDRTLHDELIANATLAHAAPDLLEVAVGVSVVATEIARKVKASHGIAEIPLALFDDLMHVAHASDAAIAKAKGEHD